MARRKSPMATVIALGTAADKAELDNYIDALRAIRDSRFAQARPRKQRSDKGTQRAAAAASGSESDIV